jgi:hypothetical protein
MLSAPDGELYEVVTAEDWVFITNNEADFRALAEREHLHPGLIVLPQGTAADQQAADAGETPADWMVMRVVVYDDVDGTVSHGWLPDPD